MTFYVLDTDMLTLYQLGHPAIVDHVRNCPAEQLAVSVITVEEQMIGWYTKIRQAKKRDELARAYQRLAHAVSFLARLQILPFPELAIERYENLRAAHRRLGKNDLRIAAIALENTATLITRNLHDFEQVPGLKIEDWSK
jgi:tRNA(fMet)-specific endonuclease VapC